MSTGKKGAFKRAQVKDYTGQKKQARTLDALAEFDKFSESILPRLKKAILENWSPERMRKEFAGQMQAMMIHKAAEGNFAAIKDTLDRHEGMAIQRVEQKTVYQQMGKRELAALALQKLKDSGLISIDGKVVKTIPSEVVDEKE